MIRSVVLIHLKGWALLFQMLVQFSSGVFELILEAEGTAFQAALFSPVNYRSSGSPDALPHRVLQNRARFPGNRVEQALEARGCSLLSIGLVGFFGLAPVAAASSSTGLLNLRRGIPVRIRHDKADAGLS
jgi:hypothetical protein